MTTQIGPAEASAATVGRDYTTSFTVRNNPADVFAAVLDVAAWWTGDIAGRTDELGAEFTYRSTTASSV